MKMKTKNLERCAGPEGNTIPYYRGGRLISKNSRWKLDLSKKVITLTLLGVVSSLSEVQISLHESKFSVRLW